MRRPRPAAPRRRRHDQGHCRQSQRRARTAAAPATMRSRSPTRSTPMSPASPSSTIRSCRSRAPATSRPNSSNRSSATTRPQRRPRSPASTQATRARRRFRRAASRSAPASLGAADQFGRIARRFDLAIVGQAEPQNNAIEELIAESALFESGRPVIVVPYIQKAPLKLDRVMVCWDGSRPAARAIADAMPLLEKAGRSKSSSSPTSAARGRDRRRRYGPASGAPRPQGRRQAHQSAADIDVADALLSHAADSGTDFIVMGGYGHSRLREFVLGGVTRSILRSMTVPVLMSH